MFKDFNNPALLNLPNTYSNISQLLTAEVKKLIARMKIQNCLQCFAVVAVFFETTVLANPVNFFAQNWNTPRTVRVELRGIESKKTYLSNRLLLVVKTLYHQVVRVDIAVHSRATRRFGEG